MRPRSKRAKPRPGSLERPVNARIYRGAWILVAIPILITAFSVDRQQPLTAPAFRPVFDGETATSNLKRLTSLYSDRSPGAANSGTLLQWIRGEFTTLGLHSRVDRFSADIPGLGERTLNNVSVTVQGLSPTAIVILAHRDNNGQVPGGGANDNASGTAVMLELARAYQNRDEFVQPPQPAHTIIFLSTDGGDYGAIGAEHYARSRASDEHVAAVIVLDSVAGRGQPRVLINGDAARSPSPILVATAFQLLSDQAGVVTHAGSLDQIFDLAFPFSLYEQAPFIARGIPAVTLTTGSDRPPPPLTDTVGKISRTHLSSIGHATEQLIAALDQGAPEPKTESAAYIYLGGRFVNGWAIQLVLIAALLPALVAIVDLLARSQRRGIRLKSALRSLGRRLGFWLFLLALFLLFSLFDLFPGGVARPLSPDSSAATSPPYGALVLFAFFAIGGWFITRERLLPRGETSLEDELAGYTSALLVLAGVSLLVLSLNRYALIFLLPPLHAWIWLPQLRHLRPWAPLAVLLVGLVGPLLVFWELGSRLQLGSGVFWYVTELAAVGYIGLPFLLAATLFAATTAQLAALSVNRFAPYPAPDERPEKTLPQRVVRRGVVLSRRWGEARSAHRTHRD
jgi:hypothetical protein